jgi:hypothetical protein
MTEYNPAILAGIAGLWIVAAIVIGRTLWTGWAR